jgi:hypothetical protein
MLGTHDTGHALFSGTAGGHAAARHSAGDAIFWSICAAGYARPSAPNNDACAARGPAMPSGMSRHASGPPPRGRSSVSWLHFAQFPRPHPNSTGARKAKPAHLPSIPACRHADWPPQEYHVTLWDACLALQCVIFPVFSVPGQLDGSDKRRASASSTESETAPGLPAVSETLLHCVSAAHDFPFRFFCPASSTPGQLDGSDKDQARTSPALPAAVPCSSTACAMQWHCLHRSTNFPFLFCAQLPRPQGNWTGASQPKPQHLPASPTLLWDHRQHAQYYATACIARPIFLASFPRPQGNWTGATKTKPQPLPPSQLLPQACTLLWHHYSTSWHARLMLDFFFYPASSAPGQLDGSDKGQARTSSA